MIKNYNKQCHFCGKPDPNWKDAETLRKFLAVSMKIKTRSKTGLCSKHQRDLAQAVKRAKQMALIPYLSY
ncbi:MAG: 30S ribosomal protein S18 [Candidatus Brennerbacteria bacterium RIFOXYC1_FULL_41_11]|uniref:Small ribosomal subunit protein bS18 n=1 Tax=Candidatus Brennerbacteria bacterium RIFOXYD1_FULL_41_16 TaxID=1797529 RepID=A0A1G1XKT6_9BACT|nr:MAG: 30S ribosomal protein S18 [Candidatus Brennerbacteria bacterium RIFOXYB1_FULL_41_13]OGY39830.1 MAG: 30S ribosomal protein S18 [Candidatus Brennerbacteria bacterium RIFOXYC1_FULL_41_11]OGY40571.1 MAG: 30S ribosomal protein S18 [Candidatus Brennerbacteria bacterium RIFOXYD1_FULL_41_16]